MGSEEGDSSKLKAEEHRLKRSDSRPEEGGQRSSEPPPLEVADDGSELANIAETSNGSADLGDEGRETLNDRNAETEQSGNKNPIDDQLIANLGSGRNDYGVLDELLPQIDFDSIPITRPKRVMAKSDPNAKGVLPDSEGKSKPEPPRTLKPKKKKPASLLDSYFKGL